MFLFQTPLPKKPTIDKKTYGNKSTVMFTFLQLEISVLLVKEQHE